MLDLLCFVAYGLDNKQRNFRRRRKPATKEHLIAPKKKVTQKGADNFLSAPQYNRFKRYYLAISLSPALSLTVLFHISE
jgi:hypothetical protein